jgi:hypothetical protein
MNDKPPGVWVVPTFPEISLRISAKLPPVDFTVRPVPLFSEIVVSAMRMLLVGEMPADAAAVVERDVAGPNHRGSDIESARAILRTADGVIHNVAVVHGEMAEALDNAQVAPVLLDDDVIET